jgi:acetate---CoA ligase (ADP-forming)
VPETGRPLDRLLQPRSIAIVGASRREGSFGDRMARQALNSPAGPRVHLVNPRYTEVLDQPCVPSLADIEEPVDLVMLGVPDPTLPEQLQRAADHGAGAAVVFGTAHGLGPELASIARSAGMHLCGGGSMGFVNPARGIRALGYIERERLAPGGVAIVTHSGSSFSSMLRTHRALDFSVVVSAGQELVTSMSQYLDYALSLDETRVVGLFAETLRDADGMRRALARAVESDIPVVALTVGGSPTGRSLVEAHSGAIAGDDAVWEALFSAYGVHRVTSLDELIDTLELFAIGRRVRPGTPRERLGVATVHDSGGERALVADRADALAIPFSVLADKTRKVLAELLDPGLVPANPLDVWGRGTNTETLFAASMAALDDDPGVAVVAAGLDLVEEYDGDMSYPRAIQTVAARTDKPVVVLSNLASAVDQRQAALLRSGGIPVLEGTDSGLKALGHLLVHAIPTELPRPAEVDTERAARWRERIRQGLSSTESLDLLGDYGIATVSTRCAATREAATAAAEDLGLPVVLKTAAPDIAHKTDADGVRPGLADLDAVGAAYDDIAARLGPAVLVQQQVPAGVEVALGLVHDPLVGPIVVVATGGTLIEVMPQRAVTLPPVTPEAARDLVAGLQGLSALLGGVRGAAASDVEAVVAALVGVGQLAAELGDEIAALDVNPLICTSEGAIAVDALLLH